MESGVAVVLGKGDELVGIDVVYGKVLEAERNYIANFAETYIGANDSVNFAENCIEMTRVPRAMTVLSLSSLS